MPQVKAIISLDSWSSIQAKNSRPGIQTAAAMTQWGDSVGIRPCWVEMTTPAMLRWRRMAPFGFPVVPLV
jgi:hypothetical protein